MRLTTGLTGKDSTHLGGNIGSNPMWLTQKSTYIHNVTDYIKMREFYMINS